MVEWLRRLLSDPLHSFMAGFISGVFIEFIVSQYFYSKGIRKRRLTYNINSVRTQIMKTGEASRLSVLHDGQEINEDIMAVHIAIWNEGRESIRQEHMLRSMIIETENDTPILETNIRKVNRDVVELTLDESRCNQGKLGVSWKILEERDCGMIQIIYAGSPDLVIAAHATIEGQGDIINYSYISQFPGGKKTLYQSLRLVFLLFLIFNLEVYLYFSGSELSSWGQPPSSWTFWTLYLVIFLGVILYGYWVLLKILRIVKQQRPPLEF